MTELVTTPTQKYLEQLRACREAREWVGDQTLEQAWQSCTRLDWMQWLVTESARVEFERATAPAWAEYKRVLEAAQAEYDRATAAARADYRRAVAPAWAEYERATAAAWSEYKGVTAAARACETCDELRQKFSCPRIEAVP